MDFTVTKYKELLSALMARGHDFQTFEEYMRSPKDRAVILRHDVDLLPQNSLAFARIQAALGIQGTYYFRAVPESWDENAIKEISRLGHEIGYHYECLTTCQGNLELGIGDFEKNLADLRELAPVRTICMHGSPMSKYDSKELWKTYDYAHYGILAEPYFDVDFNTIFYITDTGRKWDGHTASVRDRVQTNFNQKYHATNDIINALNKGEFPQRAMFTFHPQRWTNNRALWGKELVLQNLKNVVKKHFFVKN